VIERVNIDLVLVIASTGNDTDVHYVLTRHGPRWRKLTSTIGSSRYDYGPFIVDSPHLRSVYAYAQQEAALASMP